MAIPALPAFYNMPFTNKDGSLTPQAKTYHDNTFQTMNQVVNLFNNGIAFPNKTTVEINALEPNAILGTVWFNTNLAKLQVKTANGVIQTITST